MGTKPNILMFFTLFLISSKVKASTPKNYTKTFSTDVDGDTFPSKELITSDNSFLYATCEDNSGSCNITIDTPTEGKNSKVQTCDFKLLKNNDSGSALNDLRRFTKNNVILTWYEKEDMASDISVLKITALDMSHCNTTQITEHTIEDRHDVMLIPPLILKDTVEIFVANKTLCQNYERCRITYDHYGTQIGSPEYFPIFMKRGYPTSAGPDGIFIRGYIGNRKLRVVYINRKNSEVIDLMAESISKGSQRALHKSAVSNAHGLYTVCWQDNNDDDDKELAGDIARCMQFDHFGKKLLNATVTFIEYEELVAVYNLAEGGILLFGKTPVEGKADLINVRKIDGDGEVGMPLELNFNCNEDLPNFGLSVSESRDNFDFYMACGGSDIGFSVQHASKKYLNQWSLEID